MSEILKIIRDQLLPAIKQYGTQRLIMPPPSWSSAASRDAKSIRLRDQVILKPRKQCGPREVSRGSRMYDNQSPEVASWPSDYLVEWRMPAMVVVTEGSAEIRISDYSLCCPAGYFLLLPSGIAHCDCRRAHTEASPHPKPEYEVPGHNCALLWFAPQMMASSMMGIWQCHTVDGKHRNSDRGGECVEDYVLRNARLVTYFNSLHEELEDGRKGYEEVCQGLMMIFLRSLQRELEDKAYLGYKYSGDPNLHGVTTKEPIVRAREYIAAHLEEKLTIEQTARAVYMSRTIFVRRFQQATGQTFNEYLTEQRLERAVALLIETDWTISYISSFVGIKPDRLRVLFRTRMGVSPGDFRDQKRNERAAEGK